PQRYPAPLALHSFPTRRSSDLLKPMQTSRVLTFCALLSFVFSILPGCHKQLNENVIGTLKPDIKTGDVAEATATAVTREYYIAQIGRATSELQSRENLVCRLLL